MEMLKNVFARYANPTTVRIVYAILILGALLLAAGAPDASGLNAPSAILAGAAIK